MPKIPMPLTMSLLVPTEPIILALKSPWKGRWRERERATEEEEEGNECSNESHKRAAEITMQGALAFS